MGTQGFVQVGQRSGQSGAEAVPAQIGGDGGVADGSAGRAGAWVSLIFDDLCGQLRQFGDLVPRWLRGVARFVGSTCDRSGVRWPAQKG